jgi:hypothetical protein
VGGRAGGGGDDQDGGGGAALMACMLLTKGFGAAEACGLGRGGHPGDSACVMRVCVPTAGASESRGCRGVCHR